MVTKKIEDITLGELQDFFLDDRECEECPVETLCWDCHGDTFCSILKSCMGYSERKLTVTF